MSCNIDLLTNTDCADELVERALLVDDNRNCLDAYAHDSEGLEYGGAERKQRRREENMFAHHRVIEWRFSWNEHVMVCFQLASLSGLDSNGHCRVKVGYVFIINNASLAHIYVPSLGNQRGPDDFTLYVICACKSNDDS